MSKEIHNTLVTWQEKGYINKTMATNIWGFYEEALRKQREIHLQDVRYLRDGYATYAELEEKWGCSK